MDVVTVDPVFSSSLLSAEGSIHSGNSSFFLGFTREQVIPYVSFAYVVISILMVLLWSMYLCIDGRRSPKRDTRVIHMLAQRTFIQRIP